MLLFLDTEFTGLSHPAHARKLLSLALVAEDGSAEWYAEFDGWELADCDPWVQRHVVPLLSSARLARDAARASLHDWFAARPRRVQAACDSEIDWRLLLELLGERPSNLAAQRHDLAPLIARIQANTEAKLHPQLFDTASDTPLSPAEIETLTPVIPKEKRERTKLLPVYHADRDFFLCDLFDCAFNRAISASISAITSSCGMLGRGSSMAA